MSGLEDLGKIHENKFVHDSDLEFKAIARRDKLLGEWVAGLIGLSGAAAVAYVKAVIAADLEEKGDEDVFRKIRQDLDSRNVEMSDHRIRRKMEELHTLAREQVHTD